MTCRASAATRTALLALALLACAAPPGRMPPELVGTWTAQGGAHAGRAITFDTAFVVLWVSDEADAAYRVTGVHSSVQPGVRTDRIVLRLPGAGSDTLQVLRRDAEPGRLRLQDAPDAVWVKGEGGAY